jgi:hypothetical protein
VKAATPGKVLAEKLSSKNSPFPLSRSMIQE